jgi:hypothetical protein
MSTVLEVCPSDLLQEDCFPLAKAPAKIPSRPALQTLYRWWKRGIKGVKLEVVKVGNRPYTSREALDRFFNRISDPASHQEPTELTPTLITRRQREIESELDAVGL